MPQYRLKKGWHVDENKHRYQARDESNNVVESDRDLVKQFGSEKFELILPTSYYEELSRQAEAQAQAKRAAQPKRNVREEYDAAVQAEQGADTAVAVAEPPKATAAKPKAERGGLGDDMTEFWDAAETLGLKVFRRGQGRGANYFVTEPDLPDKPLNAQPLSKEQVQAFLDDYS